MCGISGVLTLGDPVPAERLVQGIVADQIPRGPDHQAVGTYSAEAGSVVVLGSNRLKILDLSADSNQPFLSRDERYVMVYNGLVYNYRQLREELAQSGFPTRTTGDTEVVLAAYLAWGVRAFERLNGMFALAVFDRYSGKLVLARDRFGVKPLYFRAVASAFTFASTGRVIAREYGLGPDLGYVARGLAHLVYEDGENSSMYEGLASLPPGCYVEVVPSNGTLELTQTRYYELAERVCHLAQEIAGLDAGALTDRVEWVVGDAVSLRLRSDVPLGSSLSGGLDSSLVTGLATREASNLKGFCFGHPKVRNTEGPVVHRFARANDIDVTFVWPSPQEYVEHFFATFAAQGAPFGGLGVVAQHAVFSAARKEGLRVLVGGQGGDEMFMGYRKYHFLEIRRLLAKRDYANALSLLTAIPRLFFGDLPRLPLYLRHVPRYLGRRGFSTSLALPVSDRTEVEARCDGPWARQALDVLKSSLPTLLRYEDSNSMGNGIESRLPFLDFRVAELGLALPVSLKLRGAWGKWALREIARDVVVDEIRTARFKRGFDTPDDHWVRQGLGAAIRDSLAGQREVLRHYAPEISRTELYFSDDAVLRTPHRLREAITLIWLSGGC